MVNRIEIADSLAFMLIQVLGKARLQDSPSPILLPMSGFTNDMVEWEEALSMLVIVRESHLEEEDIDELPEVKRTIFKPFK